VNKIKYSHYTISKGEIKMQKKINELTEQFQMAKIIIGLALIIGLIIIGFFVIRIAIMILASPIFWIVIIAIAFYHMYMKKNVKQQN
jgi:hypothetical protein